jgi:repressor LexA
MGVSDRIRQARKNKGLSQAELAAVVGVSQSAIGNYESGVSYPKEPIIFNLLRELGVDANFLYQDEMREASANAKIASTAWAIPLVDAYVAAPEPTQENICTLLKIDHVVPDAPPEPTMCEMIIFEYPAAAGLPLYAESDFERIEFPEDEIPDGADFGIRISGDSMEPTIADGSVVWVHKQSNIRDGEIGIFTLADSAVCKRVRLNGRGRIRQLESDNPAYEPITGNDLDDLRVVGKVLL